MGCEESRAIQEVQGEGQQVNKTSNGPDNLVIQVIEGILDTSLPFSDCLITSNDELTKNVKDFISTRKPKKDNPKETEPNINDELVTDSIAIDFSQNHVIALNAVKVVKVNNIEGNYIIFHNGQPGSVGVYTALVVKRIKGSPKIMYATPKPNSID